MKRTPTPKRSRVVYLQVELLEHDYARRSTTQVLSVQVRNGEWIRKQVKK